MVSFGFFNSSNGDRKYSADDISRIFSYLITDGILATYGDKFFTTPSTSKLGVVLGTGWAWFNHTWTQSDTAIPFDIDEPDPSLDRFDVVYLKVDRRSLGRVNSLGLVKGTAAINPQKPTFPTETDVFYHPLAYVKVRHGVTRIAASDIEILCGKTQAPFITSILQTTDITTLFQGWSEQFGTKMTQWQTAYDTQMSNQQSGYTAKINEWEGEVDALTASGNQQLQTQQTQFTTQLTNQQNTFTTSLNGWEADFTEWFENLQTYLSQDVVTAIWADLEELKTGKVNVSDKATNSDVIGATNDAKWITPKSTKTYIDSLRTSTLINSANNAQRILGYPALLASLSGSRAYPARTGSTNTASNWNMSDASKLLLDYEDIINEACYMRWIEGSTVDDSAVLDLRIIGQNTYRLYRCPFGSTNTEGVRQSKNILSGTSVTLTNHPMASIGENMILFTTRAGHYVVKQIVDITGKTLRASSSYSLTSSSTSSPLCITAGSTCIVSAVLSTNNKLSLQILKPNQTSFTTLTLTLPTVSGYTYANRFPSVCGHVCSTDNGVVFPLIIGFTVSYKFYVMMLKLNSDATTLTYVGGKIVDWSVDDALDYPSNVARVMPLGKDGYGYIFGLGRSATMAKGFYIGFSPTTLGSIIDLTGLYSAIYDAPNSLTFFNKFVYQNSTTVPARLINSTKTNISPNIRTLSDFWDLFDVPKIGNKYVSDNTNTSCNFRMFPSFILESSQLMFLFEIIRPDGKSTIFYWHDLTRWGIVDVPISPLFVPSDNITSSVLNLALTNYSKTIGLGLVSYKTNSYSTYNALVPYCYELQFKPFEVV